MRAKTNNFVKGAWAHGYIVLVLFGISMVAAAFDMFEAAWIASTIGWGLTILLERN